MVSPILEHLATILEYRLIL